MKPTFYTGDAPLEISAEMVFEIVKQIVSEGRETEFLALCDEKKLGVTLNADAINLVKGFLFASRSHEVSAMALRAIDSDRCSK